MRPLAAWALAFLALAWTAGAAEAQDASPQASRKPAPSREPGRPHSLDLSTSLFWFPPSSLGSQNANLTSNNTAGSPYRLFEASGELGNAVGLEVRVGYRLSRRLAIEGGATLSRPNVSFTIANDAEGAAGFTSSGERMSQLFVDAALVAYLSSGGLAGGRLRPFVEAGGGFLQQYHTEGGAVSAYYATDSGQVYHVGGGARYALRKNAAGAVTGLGLRFDARYYIRHGGFSFGSATTGGFAAGVGLVIAF